MNNNHMKPSFRTEKFEWLNTHLLLDMLSLDKELMEMSVLIKDAGECVSLTNEIRETAKEELENIRAKIAAKLREASTAANGKAMSETRIDSEVLLNGEFQAMQTALSTARLDYSLWQNLFEALKNKSYNISTSVELFKAGYLSVDSILIERRKELRAAKV